MGYVSLSWGRDIAKHWDTLVYDCTVAADRANGAIFPPKALTKWRDLRTNQITFATQAALSRAQNCALRLQKMGQWTDFRRDVAFFKARETRWASLVRDHGFNATPFWLAVYAPLLSDSSQVLTDDLLQKWAMIDVSFFVGSIIALYLAFGLKNTAWSLCLLAVWSPIFYFWTGGSIGRWDWFFYLALLLFCLKKEYFYLAGLCIALSILLRIFPVFHLFFLIILILCQKPKIGIKILASGLFFGFLGLIFIVFSSNFVKSIKAPS